MRAGREPPAFVWDEAVYLRSLMVRSGAKRRVSNHGGSQAASSQPRNALGPTSGPPALHLLSLGERNIAQRARREQVLDAKAAIGQPLLVRVLQQGLQRRPVLLDAVGIPVRPDDRLLLFDHRLQPGTRRL